MIKEFEIETDKSGAFSCLKHRHETGGSELVAILHHPDHATEISNMNSGVAFRTGHATVWVGRGFTRLD